MDKPRVGRKIVIEARIGEAQLALIKRMNKKHKEKTGEYKSVNDIAGELITLACQVIKMREVAGE